MKAIYGLYPDPDSAQRALDALTGAGAALGVKPADITIISGEPYEEYAFGRGLNPRDHKSLMPWMAALGGVIGGSTGFALVSLTQSAYPLPTAGMAIAPLWTNGIITYEMTMLGAIVTTVVTLLITARLPDPRKKLYDPAVADGKILVGVANPVDAKRGAIEKALREASADSIVRTQP
ncbi:MAG TPA: quinol:electron acceptor oxidoreductase subunit ActD [Terriglobia bacterium]|nr:quinol:electron acceptor oxidoreductase subunit ActD [Terriglobia bacterium]